MCCVIHVHILNIFLCILELKDFLRCATGSPCHQGNIINILFTSEPNFGLSFATCGNQLNLSELVESEEVLALGLKAVIKEKAFTIV